MDEQRSIGCGQDEPLNNNGLETTVWLLAEPHENLVKLSMFPKHGDTRSKTIAGPGKANMYVQYGLQEAKTVAAPAALTFHVVLFGATARAGHFDPEWEESLCYRLQLDPNHNGPRPE